jgi:uncharacterized membrane protein
MSGDPDRRLEEAESEARRAGQMARVALIVAAVAVALAILGLFLPIRLS